MKKNGFTVTELLVSFVIMTIVTILLFSLTISLQKLSSENYVTSELKVLYSNLTKLIKEDDELKHIPVVIFSSLVNEEMRRKGEMLGADAQLTKPEIGKLVGAIDKLLDERKDKLEKKEEQ